MGLLEDEMMRMLGPVFLMIEQHLLALDREAAAGGGEKYGEHRRDVNMVLRPFNFVVGVSHLDRHCILPLIKEEPYGK